MAHIQSEPEVGLWYRDIQSRIFEVVAVPDEDTIEVQYYDGDISELDQESWEMLCVTQISEPGDGLGLYEEDEEFLDVDSDLLHTVSWDSVMTDNEG